MTDSTSTRDDIRTRIVGVAAALMRDHGASAVTTRRVAQDADVQPPTIYRLFGDKDGLLEAVAEHVLAEHVSTKRRITAAAESDGVDPLVDLSEGWRTQVEFGVANPELFRLMSDPQRMTRSRAAEAGMEVFRTRIRRVAETGRLRVSETRALALVQAAGVGAIQVLLATPPPDRDADLSEAMLDAVLRQILTDVPVRDEDDRTAAAVAFRAITPSLDMLSASERGLLAEWLDRVVAGI
ncbi:TetR/AcrR family transcriptional regulator [Williamsia phyllosphaerae]|uniref:TetR family transcriptional regulator n=1 Tax=Williamsia phyllosphaerae TaxID=885042 RepID=A0ABQ1V565_9NOCA|nr:TetR/AcrR family transcriptional regulator [Williamsia phyllosphaerae]GGF37249.1 TetR family transcriptional regulator [Williamsia phyllosphaerae]